MLKRTMFRLVSLTLLSTLFVLPAGCGIHRDTTAAEKTELIVSAAASLTNSLKEIESIYESEHPDIDLKFNFGASGALSQQIEQGAPADLFISADTKNMNTLVDHHLVDKNQQSVLLSNKLVVIVSSDNKTSIQKAEDLSKPDFKYIAIGDPSTVPAGAYTKDALIHAGLWDSLQPKTVPGKDVRQVLTYVESGNADAGFVYRTDAMSSKKVKVAFSVDPNSYSPIQYPAGIITSTTHLSEAQKLYDFLQGKKAQDIFMKYGFIASK
ncbi:molybdate ABC transporter substrate-binding protein [Paenibacillus sediminis]|uniref:Molybdate transport system substrate-binding protein n=1 Tax=Paenibacillus sediminis TaxID=664909 RepID=A0ABS4H0C3_9BACL|nr:molybdate ABC transporter substrate-binding protein [Paenibacillus sediminis]MBP1935978.1 molybdate transport system substrate-binding protein [Paenibacillus sediminis]